MADGRAAAPAYAAFVSYRHGGRDGSWAERLHAALEAYVVPASAVRDLGLPRRIGKVFLDRAETRPTHDLGAALLDAIAASGAMVVLCSPRARETPWVDAEVRAFTERRGTERLFLVLVDGEPRDAFPPSLLAGGAVAGMSSEPLAVDLRDASGESERRRLHVATVRIAAALLGCSFDALWRREERRRARQRTVLAAVCVAAVGGGISAAHFVSEAREATRRREFESEVELARRDVLANHSASAEQHARRALTLSPGDPVARFLLACARQVAGVAPVTFRPQVQAIGMLATVGDTLVTRSGYSPDQENETIVVSGLEGTEVRRFESVEASTPDLRRGVRTTETDHGFTAHLWDAGAGDLRSLTLGTSRCESVAVSDDGRRAALVTTDGTRRRLMLAPFEAGSAPLVDAAIAEETLNAVTFTGDGASVRLLLKRGSGEVCDLLDATTGVLRRTCAFGAAGAGWLELSPDELRAVVVDRDGASRLLDTATGAEIAAWNASQSSWDVRFASDGRTFIQPAETGTEWVLRSSRDGAVVETGEVWIAAGVAMRLRDATDLARRDGDGWRSVARLVSGRSFVPSVDDRWLVDGTLLTHDCVVWDLAQSRRLGSFTLPWDPTSVTCTADGRAWFASAHGDVMGVAPSASGGVPSALRLQDHEGPVVAAVASGADAVATVDRSGVVRLWDRATGERRSERTVAVGRCESCSWTADGGVLALFGRDDVTVLRLDAAVALADRLTKAELTQIHEGDINDPADRTIHIRPWFGAVGTLSPDGASVLVAAPEFPIVAEFAVAGGGLMRRTASGELVRRVQWTERGPIAALAKGVVVANGAAVALANADTVVRCAVSFDGRLVAGCDDGTLRALSGDNGAPPPPLRLGSAAVLELAVSPDGRRLFAGCGNGYLHRVNRGTWAADAVADQREAGGRDQAALRAVDSDDPPPDQEDRVAFPDGVSTVAFRPDGRLVATGSNDSTVCVWDAESGKLLVVRRVDGNGGVRCLTWSADGRTLLAGDTFTSAFVWDMAPADE